MQLPFHVRLDLIEVQTHDAMVDFFDEAAGPIVEKTKEDAKTIAEKFIWFQELKEPLNELKITAGHALREEQDLCVISPAESLEKIKAAKEADPRTYKERMWQSFWHNGLIRGGKGHTSDFHVQLQTPHPRPYGP